MSEKPDASKSGVFRDADIAERAGLKEVPAKAESDFLVTVPPGFTWQFPAKIFRWYDGDSCFVAIRRKSGREETGVEVRLDGLQAVELKSTFGQEALAAARRIAPEGSAVMLVERNKREKYGREFSRIVLADGTDFTTAMLLEKASDGVTPLAIPYAG